MSTNDRTATPIEWMIDLLKRKSFLQEEKAFFLSENLTQQAFREWVKQVFSYSDVCGYCGYNKNYKCYEISVPSYNHYDYIPLYKIATPPIKNVIFNPPATIVFWKDGTKTVVKAQNDEPFNKEKGLAMAYIKKVFGNKGRYNNMFRKWCEG